VFLARRNTSTPAISCWLMWKCWRDHTAGWQQ
jgi:hypothetical protein